MLSQLYIQNIAVIREASIDFTGGLNVFTGETGAGKSILIGAINGVLGGRISRDLIRTGETKGAVSALFTEIPEEKGRFFEELGYPIDEEGNLLVSRTFSAEGKSSCKVNGRPATLQLLRELSSQLLRIHGQHDNSQLFSQEFHMEFIDRYGDLVECREEYGRLFVHMQELEKQRRALEMDEGEKARRLDLLQYQIDEIEDAQLQPGEEEELLALRRRLQNAARIMEGLTQSQELLEGGEEFDGAVSILEELSGQLSFLSAYIEETGEMGEKVQGMAYELQEYARDLREFFSQMDVDPAQAQEVEDRLDCIRRLERKYGGSYEEIQRFYEKACKELDNINFSQERISQIEHELAQVKQQATERARELSAKRMASGEEFARKVCEELRFLNMPSVRLEVSNKPHGLSKSGVDALEFLISTNPGEPPKPMAKIASGGELSRIMLAIQNVLAQKDQVDTMIFDEIDTGVSGGTAQKIGLKLRQVSNNRQVLCVTHLAQIAAFANTHLLIEKQVVGERTETKVHALSQKDRVQELARIMSGDELTPAALKAAGELMELSEKSAEGLF